MIGSLLNASTILAGGLIGLLIGKRLSKQSSESLMIVLGCLTLIFGIQMVLETRNILVPVVALILGTIAGEAITLETRLEQFALRLEGLVAHRSESQFARAFLTTSIVYCTGALVILGPFEEGLTGTYKTLLLKSTIDGIASIVFATTMGWGVLFAAIPVLLIEGGLTLGASFLNPWVTPGMIGESSATGGAILILLGLKIMGVKPSRVANLIPALLIAPLLVKVLSLLNISLFTG